MSLWSCTTCSKSFSRKGDLTRHQSLHTGIRPYVCETCGKGFAQFSGLKTHRNVHSKAKPYICGIGTCTKAFGDPSSRTRHRRETHRREGAYKCIVAGCETRIKRRSAFVAHLRKHGLDPILLDLDAIVLRDSEGEVPAPAHFTSPAVENNDHHQVESRGGFPSLLGDTSRYFTLGNNGEANHLMDTDRWYDLFDHRQVGSWSPSDDNLPLGTSLGRAVHKGPSGPPDDFCPNLSNNPPNPPCFNAVLPTTADRALVASSLNFPVFEPFLSTGIDGSRSSSSSPSSTCSALYNTDFDGVVPLSLPNTSEESFLYSIL